MNILSRRQGAARVAPILVVVLLALVATTAQAQTFTVLHTFTGGRDGVWPQGGVVQDTAGNLYGTTLLGGSGIAFGCNIRNIGCGVVFKVDTSGTETVLHRFVGRDGAMPAAGLLIDPNRNIYGTTDFGGTSGWGAVFKLGTALYSFKGQPDGAQPVGSLVQDASR